MQENRKEPLGVIDPENLLSDEKLLFPIHYEMFPDEKTFLILKQNLLIISTKYFDKIDKVWSQTQEEFPLSSLPWIIDRIENGFWKKPSEGGLSDFERSVSAEFEGEKVGINVMMHCCAENVPGYRVWNSSRSNYIDTRSTQSWQIPRYMLKDGLLDDLKKIANQFC